MIIKLTIDQERRLLEWAGAISTAHTDIGFEPHGYTLEVTVAGPYGACASAISGSTSIDLGEVAIELDRVT